MSGPETIEERLNGILSSPEQMQQILRLARTLSDEAEPTQAPASEDAHQESSGNAVDPQLLETAAKLLGAFSEGRSDKEALLRAMKPYLRRERAQALERAMTVTRIARAAKAALGEMGGGRNV